MTIKYDPYIDAQNNNYNYATRITNIKVACRGKAYTT